MTGIMYIHTAQGPTHGAYSRQKCSHKWHTGEVHSSLIFSNSELGMEYYTAVKMECYTAVKKQTPPRCRSSGARHTCGGK